jgi:hypothetical protein
MAFPLVLIRKRRVAASKGECAPKRGVGRGGGRLVAAFVVTAGDVPEVKYCLALALRPQ